MNTKLFAGVAFAALLLPAAAFAQSTASSEIDNDEIVVTGTANREVGGIEVPDQPKAKVTVGAELIQRQRPGQTVNEIINLVPGVSNQSNDPYGSGGGGFRIRGFDSSRISQTQDGIPLNDTGNYAIYTNQQQDSETLESVTVNLGATDVDSPTASAVGGTINIRTRVPGDELGALFSGSYGDYGYHRVFGMLDSGDITGIGTKAFVSGSWTTYQNPFNNYGKIRKQQFNARLYQELGANGDFLSIAGNYNENRNNFFGSAPLRDDGTRVPGTGSGNRFPRNFDEATYTVNTTCTTTTPIAGVANVANTCGTEFDRRYNPSNTGNIRGNSRFTLTDGLVLTIDPSFQYVKANGGGTITGRETIRTIGTQNYTGFSGNNYYFGTDLNGDGDVLDTVSLLSPSQTSTRRYIVIANLIYDLTDDQTVRLAYTYDRGRHRQTGEVGKLFSNGEPTDVFSVNDPVVDANGNVIQKRDRKSFATLNQVSGQYRGEFLSNNLTLDLGVRVPFFKRELDQNCFTTSAGGFVDCVPSLRQADYAAQNPTFARPQRREYKYDAVLPNVGFTFNLTPQASVFASYAKGLSVPGTDVLYNAFFYAPGTDGAEPQPERTDSFDLGVRYRSGKMQAQVSGFYTTFENRIATAFDAELGESVSRNIGEVTRWGVDASVSYNPIPEVTAYIFGSYLNSEIKDDLLGGNCSTALVSQQAYGCTATTQQYFFPTAGKQESGVSEYMFGGRIQGTLGPVEVGAQYKRTGPRYINDSNLPLVARTVAGSTVTTTELYPARTDAYDIVDLDARFSMAQFGLRNTHFQLNVSNLLDSFFIGYVSGQTNDTSVPFVQIGVPRTVSGSIVIGF
ncbi:TonB-dependent receptor [Sphingomonas sp. CFBP 13720]|nr:TonB-dependent receptor [Sphingomonas sp. CFBP 13720]MBD8677590.1 TonB-dependent receptor [Sphingomonas sp. CFBP 13720]